MSLERLAHRRGIRDVRLHKGVARIGPKVGQRVQVPGVGEFVHIDDRVRRVPQQVTNEVGADEARAASDNNVHRRICRWPQQGTKRAKGSLVILSNQIAPIPVERSVEALLNTVSRPVAQQPARLVDVRL